MSISRGAPATRATLPPSGFEWVRATGVSDLDRFAAARFAAARFVAADCFAVSLDKVLSFVVAMATPAPCAHREAIDGPPDSLVVS